MLASLGTDGGRRIHLVGNMREHSDPRLATKRCAAYRVVSLLIVLAVTPAPVASAQTPQTRWTLATGPADGIYQFIGKQVQDVVRSIPDPRFDLDLKPSNGTFDNLDLLSAGTVDFAFAQSDGLMDRFKKSGTLERQAWRTVMAITEAPVQIVVGPGFTGHSPSDLSFHRIAVGPDNTGANFTATYLLNALGIGPDRFTPVGVGSFTAMQDALSADKRPPDPTRPSQPRAQVGIWALRAPTTQVAALLCDPDFSLLNFATLDLEVIRKTPFPYSVTTIDEKTYPNQRLAVTTVAVPTLLLSRSNVPFETVQRVTLALLEDLSRPATESKLKQSGSTVDLSRVRALTTQTRAAAAREWSAPFHDGAVYTIDHLPYGIRFRAQLDVLFWLQWLMFALVLLVFSHFRGLRLRALRLMPRVLSGVATASFLRALIRQLRHVLFSRLGWDFVRVVSLVALIVLAGALTMWSFEHEDNADFSTLRRSTQTVLVYLFSGLENSPVTTGGWPIAVAVLLVGLLIVAYITGRFASEIWHYTERRARMRRHMAKDGLLLIGWHSRAERVLKEFFNSFESGFPERRVTVLIDDGQSGSLAEEGVGRSRMPPTEDYRNNGVVFVEGNALDQDTLEGHGAHLARAVIVLADLRQADPDARSALCVLTLRSLCADKKLPDSQRPRICVEATDHQRAQAIRQAGADEVICHEHYGLGILAQCALGNDVRGVYEELLAVGPGNCELYFLNENAGVQLRRWVGRAFGSVAAQLSARRDIKNPMMLMGLKRGGQLHLNPRSEMIIEEDDSLVVLSWQRPQQRDLDEALDSSART